MHCRYVWPSSWGLSYLNSYAICISCQALTIIMLAIYREHLKRLNTRLDLEEDARGVPADKRGFRYML